MVGDSTFSYKTDYVIVIKNFLNPEGHQNPISSSKVTTILLKGWILPNGEALAGEGLPCSLRSLVFCCKHLNIDGTVRKEKNSIYLFHKNKMFIKSFKKLNIYI